jgi:hypothetical protein
MNVIFHSALSIGISAAVINPITIEKENNLTTVKLISILFCLGIISHGLLDIIPHCYPINSKIDFLISLFIICTTILCLNKRYRVLVAFSFIGALFPDIIDLSIPILNKYAYLNLPVHENYFPWHWKYYSGSIYSSDCTKSSIYQAILLASIIIVCYLNRWKYYSALKNDNT